MILMLDNYDSFTYNLVQYLGEIGEELYVVRNDQVGLSDIEKLSPSHIILSPGPGTPDDAGVCLEVISHFKGQIPILGVCLGHQTIIQAFGGEVVRAMQPMHGKVSPIHHRSQTIFRGIPSPFMATRYHSLISKRDTLPSALIITAETDEVEVMGIQHKHYPIEGVQFHPESIMSEHGKKILRNFVELYRKETE